MGIRERRARARTEASFGTEDLEKDYFLLEHHGLIDPDERVDLGNLTDLPGVGESTARKLRRAGISTPVELQGKSQAEIAAIDGIGPKTAARIRAYTDQPAPNAHPPSIGVDDDPQTERSKSKIRRRSGWIGISDVPTLIRDEPSDDDLEPHAETVRVEGQDKEDAIERHAERSPQARRADEAFNAPIMLDYETWAQNPDRYDYPGVDTISKSTKVARVRGQLQRAFEMGAVDTVDISSSAIPSNEPTTRGKFSEFDRSVKVSSHRRRAEDTLAHEVGHAADAHLGRPSGGFFDDERVRGETKELIQKREGGRIADDSHALGSDRELWANLFTAAAIEPRATKRDAPTAYRALEEEVHGGFGPI